MCDLREDIDIWEEYVTQRQGCLGVALQRDWKKREKAKGGTKKNERV